MHIEGLGTLARRCRAMTWDELGSSCEQSYPLVCHTHFETTM